MHRRKTSKIVTCAIVMFAGGCVETHLDRGAGATSRPAFADESAQLFPPGGSLTTQPTEDAPGVEDDAAVWKQVSAILGFTGETRGSAYVVRVPRNDLSVNIEGMVVPIDAGVESQFGFYHCSCGKTSVIGQICVTDGELNAVIDALRAGQIEIVSSSPMLLHTRTNPLFIRLQGEGKSDSLARALHDALAWTQHR